MSFVAMGVWKGGRGERYHGGKRGEDGEVGDEVGGGARNNSRFTKLKNVSVNVFFLYIYSSSSVSFYA